MKYVYDHLQDFVYDLNHKEGHWSVRGTDIQRYTDLVSHSFNRQFCTPQSHEDDTRLRMSHLAQPVITQCLPKLGFISQKVKHIKTLRTFHNGDIFEAFIVALLSSYLPDEYIIELNPTVEVEGIKGHPDVVIWSPTEEVPTVLEIKTMNEWTFRRYSQNGVTNDRGHVGQLAVYAGYYNTQNAYFIIGNNGSKEAEIQLGTHGTCEVALLPCDMQSPETIAIVDRAYKLAPEIAKVTTLDKMFALSKKVDGCHVPEPVLWTVKAGTFYTLPDTLKYIDRDILECFYELGSFMGSTKPIVECMYDKKTCKENLLKLKERRNGR